MNDRALKQTDTLSGFDTIHESESVSQTDGLKARSHHRECNGSDRTRSELRVAGLLLQWAWSRDCSRPIRATNAECLQLY